MVPVVAPLARMVLLITTRSWEPMSQKPPDLLPLTVLEEMFSALELNAQTPESRLPLKVLSTIVTLAAVVNRMPSELPSKVDLSTRMFRAATTPRPLDGLECT